MYLLYYCRNYDVSPLSKHQYVSVMEYIQNHTLDSVSYTVNREIFVVENFFSCGGVRKYNITLRHDKYLTREKFLSGKFADFCYWCVQYNISLHTHTHAHIHTYSQTYITQVKPQGGIFVDSFNHSDDEVSLHYTMVANDLVLWKYAPPNGTGFSGSEQSDFGRNVSTGFGIEIHRRWADRDIYKLINLFCTNIIAILYFTASLGCLTFSLIQEWYH